MAQAGLNDDKNWRSEISLDCPFGFKPYKFFLKNYERKWAPAMAGAGARAGAEIMAKVGAGAENK